RVADARAWITSFRVSRSSSAEDSTISCRFGTRLARSWNAASTSAHLALALSSAVGTELMPQAVSDKATNPTTSERLSLRRIIWVPLGGKTALTVLDR